MLCRLVCEICNYCTLVVEGMRETIGRGGTELVGPLLNMFVSPGRYINTKFSRGPAMAGYLMVVVVVVEYF